MSRRARALSLFGVLLAAVLAACVAGVALRADDAQLPTGPQPYGAVRIVAEPVQLEPGDVGPRRLGALTFLWGARLRAEGTSRLTGLSGLEVAPAGDTLDFTAVTDAGDLLRWSAPAAERGRFSATPARFGPLSGLDGAALANKAAADAEDLSLDGRGGLYVAFEGEHRVWRYAPAEAPITVLRPTPAAAWPRVALRPNRGFEAVAVLRRARGDVLAVGAEDGRVWLCGLEPGARCEPLAAPPPDGFALTGFDQLDGTDDLIAVYRAYDPLRGMRAVVARIATGPLAAGHARVTELARLERPLTRENFEGIAALPNGRGGWTLWLVSDDGFPPGAATLLYAFDYTPAGTTESDASAR